MLRARSRSILGSAVLCVLMATFSGFLTGCKQQTSPPAPSPPQADTSPQAAARPVSPAPVATAVRMKFQEFSKSKTRMDSLIKAVEVMKKRSTAAPTSVDYRLSWEYWAAMHGFYGSQAKAGLLQNAINRAPANKKPFFKGLRDLTYPPQPTGVAAQVWDKCTHGNLQFLAWHRMYLYYLERVLQDAAKDKTLRLPYWDYTDPVQVQLPAAFAPEKLSDGRPNPLNDPRRRSQTVKLDPQTTKIDDLLKKTTFSSFSGELEQQPHGTVHCTVGPDCPYPLMGDVPVAANDPIFWLHHANIDRIFECWLKRGGKLPDSLKSQKYSFLDTNGALVTKSVGDFFSASSPIDYVYDHVTNCGRNPIRGILMPSQAEAAAPPVAPLAKVESVSIGDASTSIRLTLPEAGADRLQRSLALSDESSTTELALENITVSAPPGVLFNIYLSTTGPNPRRQYVATLSFFGMDHGDHGHGGTLPNRILDVTDELQALKGTGEQMPDIQVVFEATDGTADSRLEAVRPLFNRQSGLKVGNIHLDLRGPQ